MSYIVNIIQINYGKGVIRVKNNKGITLMSLVITIVILLLISTVTIDVGIGAYSLTKEQNFISQLKLVQSKVDNFVEETQDFDNGRFTKLSEIENSDSEAYKLFQTIISNPEEYNINVNKSWNDELDGNVENYYYFKDNDLEKIGLKDQEITVVINFKTRNVIAQKGIMVDNKKYYRQYDLQGGDQLINP